MPCVDTSVAGRSAFGTPALGGYLAAGQTVKLRRPGFTQPGPEYPNLRLSVTFVLLSPHVSLDIPRDPRKRDLGAKRINPCNGAGMPTFQHLALAAQPRDAHIREVVEFDL
ncbi:MAG: hypothetical protein ACRBN8_39000 [Nannocystales bacterium]